jgi:hypothetical protein
MSHRGGNIQRWAFVLSGVGTSLPNERGLYSFCSSHKVPMEEEHSDLWSQYSEILNTRIVVPNLANFGKETTS